MAKVANNACVLGAKLVSPPLVNWRKDCPGIRGKLKHLLDNGLHMDVTFQVGSEKGEVETIRAHKLILAMSSSVFEAMFTGQFVENGDSVDEIIVIPDIHPSAFHALLKFIYSEEMSVQLSTSDILDILYAAKKYDIMELEMKCMEFLKSNISGKNVVSIFQAAQMFDEDQLKEEAHVFLKRNFEIVMQCEDFLNISKENLRLVLRDDETCASELSIFYGVLRWAEAACQDMSVSVTPDNQRLALGDILQLVRLPVMTNDDLALKVIPSRILTPEECILLLQHKAVAPQNRYLLNTLPFSDHKRPFSAYKAVFYDKTKGEYADLSLGWYNRFSVDHPVSIVSFGFNGPYDADNASYTVSIKLLKETETGNCAVLGEETFQKVAVKVKEIFHGPLTSRGFTVSRNIEVVVPVNTPFQNVKFKYTIVGAHQLPEIMFHV